MATSKKPKKTKGQKAESVVEVVLDEGEEGPQGSLQGDDTVTLLKGSTAGHRKMFLEQQKAILADLRLERVVRWDSLVVVGCGGNWWYLQPYAMARLASLMQRVVFVDPDHIEERNYNRQWVGVPRGMSKAEASMRIWQPLVDEVSHHVAPIREVRAEAMAGHISNGTLVLALPDNDAARIDACIFAEDLVLEGKAETVAVVTSGTETGRGQVLYGLLTRERGWCYDFRDTYGNEVSAEADARTPGCGQDAVSNYMTGAVTALAIEELLGRTPVVSEWFWTSADANGNPKLFRREVLSC